MRARVDSSFDEPVAQSCLSTLRLVLIKMNALYPPPTQEKPQT
jgi:hypothetical protein